MDSVGSNLSCASGEERPIRTIRFEEPETCPFLQEVLQCAASGTAYEKLDVLQDLQSALPDPFGEERTSRAVGVTTYLLEKGLLGEVVRGVEEAADGNWVEVKQDGKEELVLNKAVLYCRVLEKLMQDKRCAKFILERWVDLLDVLQRLYLLERADYPHPCTNGTMDSFVFATGSALLSTLHTLLIWSHGVKRSLARRPVFLNCILRRVGENFDSARYINESLMVFLWPAPHMVPRTLERIAPLCLSVVTRVLIESESRHEIETVLIILHKLAAFNLPFLCSHFFNDRQFLDCARALAACSSLSVFSKRFGEAVLLSDIQRKVGVQLEEAEYKRLMAGKTTEEERRRIRKGIMKSRTMLARSRTLTEICATEKSRLSLLLDSEIGEGSDGQSSQEPSPEGSGTARSFKMMTHPLRQCSAPECKNVEERSKEFASCSQCKLAAYCSRACQKRAWKAGHSTVCEQ